MKGIITNRTTGIRAIAIAALAGFMLASVGCQQTQLIFNDVRVNSPSERAPRANHDTADSASRFKLAGYAPIQDLMAEESGIGNSQSTDTTPPATVIASQSSEDVSSNGADAKQPSAIAYTAPALGLVPIVVASGQFDGSGGASDANVARIGANSLVSGTGGIVGRTGLTGATPTVGGTLNSRPGLNEGFTLGLGSANPTNNLFTRGANPLSGPNGRCNELAGAGFFGGNRPTCENPARR